MKLTKEETETLIFTLEAAEQGFYTKPWNNYMCNQVNRIYNDCAPVFIHDYLKSWYEFDGVRRRIAYENQSFEVPSNRYFARLVWLDFMLFELYDHLNSFES